MTPFPVQNGLASLIAAAWAAAVLMTVEVKAASPEVAQPVVDIDDTLSDKPGDGDVAFDSVDLGLLSGDITMPAKPAPRRPGAGINTADNGLNWSRTDKPNGSAAVTVRRAVSPFLDTRVGADLDVATMASPRTTEDPLPEKFAGDARASRSNGSAWASLTAPGLIVWDKASVEARVNPGEEQGRLKTSISKSLPLWDNQFSLTLRNDYSLTQHSMPGLETTVTRSVDVDRSAKLGVTETGTSLIAGRSLSSSNDRWLNKFGAEQLLPGGVSVTATVSQTPDGTANKGIAAAFRKNW